MFDAVYKLAQSSRQATHLQGFRLKDGFLRATNIVTSVQLQDTRLNGLDCYVEAARFIAAFRNVKNPRFEQHEGCLRLIDGDYEIDIPTRDVDDFPDLDQPSGESIETSTFIESIQKLRPFLRNSKEAYCSTLIYVLGGYVWWTDCYTLIRVKTDVTSKLEPIILSKEFIDILVDLKQETLAMNADEDTCSIWVEDGWIHSHQDTQEPPIDLLEYTAVLNNAVLPPIDAQLLENLRRLCSSDNDGTVVFDEKGITLDGKSKTRIKGVSMPPLKIPSKSLKKMLSVVTHVDWTFSDTMVAFKGPHVEGFLSTSP